MNQMSKTESEAPSDRKQPRLRRSYLIALVMAVLAVGWIASGLLDNTVPEGVETVADRTGQPSAPVQVRVADLTAVEHPRIVIVTGRTEAVTDATVAAETPGQVARQLVEKGSTVEKGTVILELAMEDRAARLKEAEARIKFAEITYKAAKDLQRKQFESEIRLAESGAELATAEAALASIRQEIAHTRIRAPIDGYVEDVMPGVGDYLGVGDPVATMVDLDPIRVVVQVTERDIGDIRVDDLATVRLPSGREIGGTVSYVGRVAHPTTRTFRVDVRIDNPDGAIQAGLTSEVRLDAGRRMAHKVPSSALTLNDEGIFGVRAVDDDDIVRFHPVRLIEDTADGSWVAGLPQFVRVITLGQEFVIEGQTVAPTTGDSVSGADAGAKPEGGDAQ